MCRAFQRILVVMVTVSAIGCANHRGSDPESAFASPTGPSAGPGLDSSTGGTLKETLTGPPIAGVTPEGQALADESRFQSGGSTILTVQIRKVNLPDGTVLNVGTGRQTTIAEAVDVARELFGLEAEPEWETHAPRPWDTDRWVADPGRARRLLGWQATTTLADGLRATAEWLRTSSLLERLYRPAITRAP